MIGHFYAATNSMTLPFGTKAAALSIVNKLNLFDCYKKMFE